MQTLLAFSRRSVPLPARFGSPDASVSGRRQHIRHHAARFPESKCRAPVSPRLGLFCFARHCDNIFRRVSHEIATRRCAPSTPPDQPIHGGRGESPFAGTCCYQNWTHASRTNHDRATAETRLIFSIMFLQLICTILL